MNKRKTIRILLLNSAKQLLLMRVVDPTTTRVASNKKVTEAVVQLKQNFAVEHVTIQSTQI